MGILANRDAPTDLLLKLQQDKFTHQQTVLTKQNYHQPDYQKQLGRRCKGYSD